MKKMLMKAGLLVICALGGGLGGDGLHRRVLAHGR